MITTGHKENGFTLIELAVVITIIGLIIGGVVVGRSLIRSSELVAVSSEYAKYTQAISKFLDKYNALPGDFKGAETLWGQAAATPALCLTTMGTTTETCNGDANGRIVTQTDYTNTAYEQFRAWQHLGNAQMIDGNYPGVRGSSGNYDRTPGYNVPASKLSGAGWSIITITPYDISNIPITAILYLPGDVPSNTLLWFGGGYLEASVRTQGVLTPAEAYEIDLKLDDGGPGSGKILAQSNIPAGNCLNPLASTPTYNVTLVIDKVCALAFKTGF